MLFKIFMSQSQRVSTHLRFKNSRQKQFITTLSTSRRFLSWKCIKVYTGELCIQGGLLSWPIKLNFVCVAPAQSAVLIYSSKQFPLLSDDSTSNRSCGMDSHFDLLPLFPFTGNTCSVLWRITISMSNKHEKKKKERNTFLKYRFFGWYQSSQS